MTEKTAGTTKQLGTRLDPPLADWIQTTAKRLGITQGELVTKMQKVYIENDVTQKYPNGLRKSRMCISGQNLWFPPMYPRLSVGTRQMTAPVQICRRYWNERTTSLSSS